MSRAIELAITIIAHNRERIKLNVLIGEIASLSNRFSIILSQLDILPHTISLSDIGRLLSTLTKRSGKRRLCQEAGETV